MNTIILPFFISWIHPSVERWKRRQWKIPNGLSLSPSSLWWFVCRNLSVGNRSWMQIVKTNSKVYLLDWRIWAWRWKREKFWYDYSAIVSFTFVFWYLIFKYLWKLIFCSLRLWVRWVWCILSGYVIVTWHCHALIVVVRYWSIYFLFSNTLWSGIYVGIC